MMNTHAAMGVLLGALSMFTNAAFAQQPISIDSNRDRTLSVENGQTYMWGGIGGTSTSPQSRPSPVLLPAAPIAVSAAQLFSLFLLPSGQVWSAGLNGAGELGRVGGPIGPGPFGPAPVSVVPQAVGIEAATGGGYAWTAGGTLYGWGLGVAQLTPTPIILPTPVVSVSSGALLTLVLDSLGQVWAWGSIFPGAFPIFTPQMITGLPPIAAVETSATNAIVLTTTGAVYQLDFSTTTGGAGQIQLSASQVLGLPPIWSIAASDDFGVCLDFSGNVYTFGNPPPVNGYLSGTLAGPAPGLTAIPINSLQNIVEISADHAIYARDVSGDLWVLGEMDYAGGLGLGNFEASVAIAARVPMVGLVPATASSANPQTASGQCAAQWYPLWRPTFPALGGEIGVSSIAPPGTLLFVAPGAATPPQALSPDCMLFLDIPGLAAYLAAGIGPFPANRVTVGAVQTFHEWAFPIPNSPALSGVAVTVQLAWPAPGSTLGFGVSAGQTFVIN